jgi:hypothetical protein
MIGQEVTLTLPEAVYRQIKRAAEKANRPIDELLVEAVSAVAPVIDTTSPQTRTALAQMAYLNDAALWQCARSTMPVAQREQLEALHQEQQRRALTPEEQNEEKALLKLYQETLLVRAQAAVLLKQRGYSVSDLTQFTPLE